jgi:hypothetical protein
MCPCSMSTPAGSCRGSISLSSGCRETCEPFVLVWIEGKSMPQKPLPVAFRVGLSFPPRFLEILWLLCSGLSRPKFSGWNIVPSLLLYHYQLCCLWELRQPEDRAGHCPPGPMLPLPFKLALAASGGTQQHPSPSHGRGRFPLSRSHGQSRAGPGLQLATLSRS